MNRTQKRNIGLTAAGIAAAAAAYHFFIRPKHLKWGTQKEEADSKLPGDELIQNGQSTTHAINIDAPIEDVWPWFVQLGQDRAGFYSYTWLENLFGCHMKNAHEVRSEWQSLKVGDSIFFHPKYPPVPVAKLVENECLVMHANAGQPDETTWGFYLVPMGENQTRLIVRLRTREIKGVSKVLNEVTVEPAHFIMERKMMLTVKELAEKRYRQRSSKKNLAIAS